MSEIQKNTQFESQFNNTKTVESFSGSAKYVEIKPEFTHGEMPILVASGWSEGRKSFHDTAEELYSRNRHSILVDHARFGKVPENETEYKDEVVHKANTLLRVLDDTGVEKADVIAHSEGAINAVIAALDSPERFNSLVLAMPAGLIGEDSMAELAKRFAPKVFRSLTKDTKENPRIGLAINLGGSAYMAKNPAKAYREVSALASTKIDTVLGELREKGVKIAVLQSAADTVFPADRIEQNVRFNDGDFSNVDAYASVASKDAGHDEILIRPERATYGALQLIDSL